MRIYLNIILILTFVFFITVASVSAQNFEHGKPSELKDLTKAFIDTKPEGASREQIVTVIQSAKLAKLKIVDSEDDAEILIVFVSDTETKNANGKSRDYKVGKGVVSIVGKNIRGQRILITFSAIDDGTAAKNPVENFAREFVKDYKKANHLK